MDKTPTNRAQGCRVYAFQWSVSLISIQVYIAPDILTSSLAKTLINMALG